MKTTTRIFCRQCGTAFERANYEIKRNKGGRFYCSVMCRNKGNAGKQNPNYGKRNSTEVKLLMSKNRSGKAAWNKGLDKDKSESVAKYAVHLIGNQFGKSNRGKKHPKLLEMNLMSNPMRDPEIRKRASESLKGKFAGEKNPNWRGGSSFGPYCPKFNQKLKEEIRNEFNRTCLICGKPEHECNKRLSIHHLDYDRDQGCNGKTWTLVPLCTRCHTKTNYNRDYWIELINSLLYSKRFEVILWL